MIPNETQLANRRRLIAALRAEMPACFTWDFSVTYRRGDCGSVGCAIGLACEIGLTCYPGLTFCREAIGLSKETATAILTPPSTRSNLAIGYEILWEDITPQMVADRLEALGDAS